jgi:hypothetical protein
MRAATFYLASEGANRCTRSAVPEAMADVGRARSPEAGDAVMLNMMLLIFNGLQQFRCVSPDRAGFWQLPFLPARNRE